MQIIKSFKIVLPLPCLLLFEAGFWTTRAGGGRHALRPLPPPGGRSARRKPSPRREQPLGPGKRPRLGFGGSTRKIHTYLLTQWKVAKSCQEKEQNVGFLFFAQFPHLSSLELACTLTLSTAFLIASQSVGTWGEENCFDTLQESSEA